MGMQSDWNSLRTAAARRNGTLAATETRRAVTVTLCRCAGQYRNAGMDMAAKPSRQSDIWSGARASSGNGMGVVPVLPAANSVVAGGRWRLRTSRSPRRWRVRGRVARRRQRRERPALRRRFPGRGAMADRRKYTSPSHLVAHGGSLSGALARPSTSSQDFLPQH